MFREILFIKIKLYLNKSVKKEEFISKVNFAIKCLHQYPFNSDELSKSIGLILNRYDVILQKKIYAYRSPIQGPIVKILRNISQIRAYNNDLMIYSFSAIKDSLINLVGRPLVNNKLTSHKLDSALFHELEYYFDSETKEFISHLVDIRSAA